MNMLLTQRSEMPSVHMLHSILNRHTVNDTERMPINIEANEKEVIFNFIIPGFSRNEIKVSIEEGNLKVFAQKEVKSEDNSSEVKDSQKKNIQAEWSFSQKSCTYMLPKRTDIENVSVKLENGVLQVVLPKKKEDTKLLEIK